MQRMSQHLIPPRLKVIVTGVSSLTFCMMSISSGLRSRSMDEMLSMLFLRTMPAANGLAMMPGEACASQRVVNQNVIQTERGKKNPLNFELFYIIHDRQLNPC